MPALLLPLDDRPVTYVYPQLIARVAGVEPLVAPRSLFGSLKSAADIQGISEWIQNTIAKSNPDVLLLCLDTMLYGGLINSRRSDDSLKLVQDRLNALTAWQKKSTRRLPIYAQASIMRISDNYDATEEKEYWSRYGREIYDWSSQTHRMLRGDSLPPGVLAAAEARIPADIRQDYQKTRFRNFQINQKLIDMVQQGVISRLTFSLDDSGPAGLNVHEQEKLTAMAQQASLSKKVSTYAGADEVLGVLLARWLVDTKRSNRHNPTALVRFSPEDGNSVHSRYEGQSIGDSIMAQIQACGIDLQKEDDRPNPVDFAIIVHTAGDKQGDHIFLPGQPDLRRVDTTKSVKSTLQLIEQSPHPCVLLDVAYANGSDAVLVEELLQKPALVEKLWAYSGWNTTGNSAGSALALAVANWSSQGQNLADLKTCLYIRLADDWAYQANVRATLNAVVSADQLGQQMAPYLERIVAALGAQPPATSLRFPWNRTFEVEIGVLSDQANSSLSLAK
ncbi:MAG TPA: DUF4127 family protein [Chroococcales cyanobacterium]